MQHSDFLVDRQDLAEFRWATAPSELRTEVLAPGWALLGVRRFAFTANNITYALHGEETRFWDYFPAPPRFGHIPVWGLAEVIYSQAPALRIGESIFGFFPMSTHLFVLPQKLKETGFIDGTAHRSDLPRTYNEYARIEHDPSYEAETADYFIVLRPLFMLSFFLAEHLKEVDFFHVRRVVISSASSKTGLGLAFLLKHKAVDDVEVVGLTGAERVASVSALGRYDRVVSYDRIDSLATDRTTSYVDIAGDPAINQAVHGQLATCLRYSYGVGSTRATSARSESEHELPGPRPIFFFTPSHIVARREAWGTALLRRRLSESWTSFLAYIAPLLHIETSFGRASIERVYREVLEGRAPPDKAHILSFEQAAMNDHVLAAATASC